jgi:hypothetical protein
LMATGKSISEVRYLWDRNLGQNQAECEFYSRVADVEGGQTKESAMQSISTRHTAEMSMLLAEGRDSAQGWYQTWCARLLKEYF